MSIDLVRGFESERLGDRKGGGILGVSELSLRIKRKFQKDSEMQDLWVRGEVSNLTNHRSGHIYFTLKDEKSQIQCVVFRWYAKRLRFRPEAGMKILVFGSVDTYEFRSQYQLQVLSVRPDGIGELYRAFEELKARLASEGLFDEAHKRPLPRYPSTVAVVSSPDGAVIHDIINVARRRYPVRILVVPTQVQGVGAGESIVGSIQRLSGSDVDLIILARGGGSIEDLWPFNEERVARAIYDSSIPIVSAVGHETDYTIADFTADLRAPTPSAAGELVVPELGEVLERLERYETMFDQRICSLIDGFSHRLDVCESALSPKRLYDLLGAREGRLRELERHLSHLVDHGIEMRESGLQGVVGRLNAVSPLHTLERGYSITLKDGGVVSSVRQVEIGDRIEVVVKDGSIMGLVGETNEKKR